MQIRIESTASQDKFVWWITDSAGKTGKVNISVDLEELTRKLTTQIYEEFETKRIVESKTPPSEPEFPPIDEVDESTGVVTKIPINRR